MKKNKTILLFVIIAALLLALLPFSPLFLMFLLTSPISTFILPTLGTLFVIYAFILLYTQKKKSKQGDKFYESKVNTKLETSSKALGFIFALIAVVVVGFILFVVWLMRSGGSIFGG